MSTNERPPAYGAERLRWYVLRRRRDELDLSQLDVHRAGGPSNTTLTKIESGHLEKLERVTARKLDAGLQWEPGSARRVWSGGEPEPMSSARGADLRDLRQRILATDALTPEQKARALAAINPKNLPPDEGVGDSDAGPAAM